MTALSALSDIIVDCFLTALAIYALYRLVKYLREQRIEPVAATGPVDIEVWHVLAAARKITEDAVGDTDVPG